MASKGQKFNKYTEEFIIEVLEEIKIGKSSLQISRERNIPAKTIRTWKRKMILSMSIFFSKFCQKNELIHIGILPCSHN